MRCMFPAISALAAEIHYDVGHDASIIASAMLRYGELRNSPCCEGRLANGLRQERGRKSDSRVLESDQHFRKQMDRTRCADSPSQRPGQMSSLERTKCRDFSGIPIV